MASPSTCDPAACSGEMPVGVQACSVRPDDGKSVVTRDYDVRGCVAAANGQACATTTETRVLEECPGACALDGRTCQVQQCDAATCAREEPAGAQVCRLGRVVQPTRRYFCNLTGTACDSVVRDELIQACPAGCAADGTHCRGPDGGRTDTSTVTGKVLAALSPDAYDLCPTCTFRLRGAVDSFTVTSAANASFSLADVPSGSYRLERLCGSTWLPGHAPWDALLGYAAVAVPTTGEVDVLLPKCPSPE
jgi:hypothetical protein